MKFMLSALLILTLLSCNSRVTTYDTSKIPISNAIVDLDQLNEVEASMPSKKVYIPIYSNLENFDDEAQISLQAVLSIRNTDLKNPLIIDSIDYYDTNGDRVKSFIERSIKIKAFATQEYVIKKSDLEGGSGAKFLVTYRFSEQLHSKPIFEAVMFGSDGEHQISFSSQGREIK